ncbi:hypothetical protein BOX15_Mlig027182g1 [Macrostomum lignano]|uniref:Myb-like domain-containing protein n=1 Tax=Macrostomum lignano TaxID=282301 RepID=A0A267FHH2_9PLAT|nr:hypothetical protein BOX15_Mlig027182g1 [Macrostomum lignano]
MSADVADVALCELGDDNDCEDHVVELQMPVKSATAAHTGLLLGTSSAASTASGKPGRCGYCLQRLDRVASSSSNWSPKIYVICAVCPSLQLCLRCFALGAEGGKHQRSHDYQLAACRLPLLPCGPSECGDDGEIWSWDEEVRLLDAIDAFGYGNWADVGARVRCAGRTGSASRRDRADPGEQCCRHYQRHYINGLLRPSRLFPDGRQPAPVSAAVTDLTVSASPPSSPPPADLSLSSDLSLEECQRLGLAPLRDFEFECEFDGNAAESLVCRLRPSFEADPLDSALRVAQIDAYRRRLRSRVERKRLIRRHGLLTSGLRRALADCAAASAAAATAAPAVSPLKRRPLACDCNAFDSADARLRPFLRYLEQPDCRQLIDCMARADRLRAELTQLSRLRSMGVRRLPDSLASSAPMALPFDQFGSSGLKSTLPVLTRNGAATPPPLLKQQTSLAAALPSSHSQPQSVQPRPALQPPPPLLVPPAAPPLPPSKAVLTAAAPTASRLSERERQLCRSLRLSHESYQLIKLHLLVSADQPHQLAECHPGLRPLLAFFRKQGWVTIA